MSNGAEMIAAERARQIQKEGWTPEHDDEHDDGELAIAAACYAVEGINNVHVVAVKQGKTEDHSFHLILRDAWPWDAEWDKRQDHAKLKRLVIAGALIAAEIDRLLRAEAKENK